VDFGQAISTCFSKYATFQGRARRSEYWYFTLFTVLVYAVILVLSALATSAGYLAILMLAFVIPGISVTIRRLHDTDRSGAWWWISLIPLVGAIVLLVFTASAGTPHANKYGPAPA
jgi:uncharacterized membrane protein YhaH (DUF805 family)